MKAQRLLLSLALVACVGLMYSCKDDDEESTDFNQEQTETVINEASALFETTSTEIAGSEYFEAITTLENFLYKKDVKLPQIKRVNVDFASFPFTVDSKLQQINYFDISTYAPLFYYYNLVETPDGEINAGTYFINADGELEEDYLETPTDGVVINFPYNNGAGTAILSTTNIATEYSDNGYYLTSADCTVEIEGTIVCSGTFVGTESSMNINITMGAYTFVFKYTYVEGETEVVSTSATTVKKDGTTVYSESANTTAIMDQELDFVGKIGIGALEFRATILATGEQLSDPTLDYDEVATMELYTTSGDKLGHFEFEGDVCYFYYNDGVRISPETLMPEIYAQCFTFFYSQIVG